MDQIGPVGSSRMPSHAEGQRRRAFETVEGCGGSVTRAMRRLGCPSRQTLYQWLGRHDASHERRTGRPWSHYDPWPRAWAVSFVRSGMVGRDVAATPGVPGAAVVHDWVRAAETRAPRRRTGARSRRREIPGKGRVTASRGARGTGCASRGSRTTCRGRWPRL